MAASQQQPPPPNQPPRVWEEHASMLSRLYFAWVTPQMHKTKSLGGNITHDHLLRLPDDDRSEYQGEQVQQHWDRLRRDARRMEGRAAMVLLRALWNVNWRLFVFSQFLKLLQILANFVPPKLLEQLLTYITAGAKHEAMPRWYQKSVAAVCHSSTSAPCRALLADGFGGGGLVIILGIFTCLASLLQQHFQYRSQRVGLRMQSACTQMLYAKTLRIPRLEGEGSSSSSSSPSSSSSVGQVVNIASTDAARLFSFVGYSIDAVWGGPLQIGLACYYLNAIVGTVATLSCLATIFASIPLTVFFSQIVRSVQKKKMAAKDQRISLTSEALSAISIIKASGWEPFFIERISKARGVELGLLLRYGLVGAAFGVLFMALPNLLTFVSIAVYSALHGDGLPATVAFVSAQYINRLRLPLIQLPAALSQMLEMSVALGRISNFLAMEELDGNDHEASVSKEETPMGMPLAKASSLLLMEDASFAFMRQRSTSENQHVFELQRLCLQVSTGELVGVVGSVGCGKSSLLLAMLGEMRRIAGTSVLAPGVKLAYTSQKAFVENATLRENVLFGRSYDPLSYQVCIEACALSPDLALLPQGDLTEIGEMGVGLSGGQKQRVALARALYTLFDERKKTEDSGDSLVLFLLDDPLSAVDAHVGEHIFEQCIKKLMMSPPPGVRVGVILVTHSLAFASRCDRVISMRYGEIAAMGSFADLEQRGMLVAQSRVPSYVSLPYAMSNQDENNNTNALQEQKEIGSFREFLEHASPRIKGVDLLVEDQDEDDSSDVTWEEELAPDDEAVIADQEDNDASHHPLLPSSSPRRPSASNNIVAEEKRSTGAISMHVYRRYFSAAGGPMVGLVVILLIVVGNSFPAIIQLYLKAWVDDEWHTSSSVYEIVYASLTLVSLVMILSRNIGMCLASQRASKILHRDLLGGILYAPLSFFQSNPTGRILNRFASDMEQVDESVANTLLNFVGLLATVASSVVSVAIVLPLSVVVIPPIAIIYRAFGDFFLRTSRECKRLSSTAKSPVFKALSEAMDGAETYRAFGCVDRLIAKQVTRIDCYSRAFFLGQLLNRWLSVRLDLIGATLVGVASLLALVPIILTKSGGPMADTSPWMSWLFGGGGGAATAGLAISQCMTITTLLGFLVMLGSQMEITVVAAERLLEYADVKSEEEEHRLAAMIMDNKQEEEEEDLSAVVVSSSLPEAWPHSGKLRFRNVGMRYRATMPRVLKDVSFDVPAGARVGICGRTGSGKSSLLVRLLRLADVNEGVVELDGVNIDDEHLVKLGYLRSRVISLIPQESILFSGTVRRNLDPEGLHDDAILLEVLQKVQFANAIAPDSWRGGGSDGDYPALSSTTQNLLDLVVFDNAGNFSLGMKQLICIARALVRKCVVVALDEATSACDASTDEAIQHVIRTGFDNNPTKLIVAHRIATISDSDLIFVMDQGRLVESGTPHELVATSNSMYKQLVEKGEGGRE
ncbi:hypothetical protein PPROV_000498200 [Pycnococcus provasolii]|uniref:Uncharacterized protein n=2 Tax=Pycnococcus provasolii TaxID=41880 RepID=A0A830HHA5_9CHLO|nr:hypothetical protein PPROV_000498200 [Pycnococcus provasolii]